MGLFFFFLLYDRAPDMQFAHLFFVDDVRSLAHDVHSTLRLRESNDITDGRTFRHEHDETVKAKGKAAMRRRAKFEGIQEEAKFFLSLFICKPNGFKDLVLNSAVMDRMEPPPISTPLRTMS